jgi:3-oxoacyl-[acyl-carrier protein] reductase/meso-butanediol dehydrogenase/(S,S)-butanediol dehydrogenase/diacetyl reductase
MKKAGGHIFITGASRGLGETLASLFVAKGWKVSSMARKIPKTKSSRVLQMVGSACFPEDLARAALVARQKNGPITGWINNAGMSAWRTLDEIDEGFWDRMIETNLKSVLFGAQVAAQNLMKGGVILNISSLAGKRGSANNSVYCAAKFGVNGITQALAKELGPRGIRVNAICPVYINTPGLKSALQDPNSPAQGRNVQGYLEKFAAGQSALGRLPEAREVANLCLFLASPEASAITGQCINVDCGVLPQ